MYPRLSDVTGITRLITATRKLISFKTSILMKISFRYLRGKRNGPQAGLNLHFCQRNFSIHAIKHHKSSVSLREDQRRAVTVTRVSLRPPCMVLKPTLWSASRRSQLRAGVCCWGISSLGSIRIFKLPKRAGFYSAKSN